MFLYLGIRARCRRWALYAALYTPFVAAGAVLTSLGHNDRSISDGAGFIWIALMGAGFFHAWSLRGEFARRLAEEGASPARRAELQLKEREWAQRIAREDPRRARELGVGRPDRPESFDAGVVDLNTAPMESIAQVTGVTRAVAAKVVAAREAAGPFVSVDDLDLVADLDVEDLARLRDAGVCVAPD